MTQSLSCAFSRSRDSAHRVRAVGRPRIDRALPFEGLERNQFVGGYFVGVDVGRYVQHALMTEVLPDGLLFGDAVGRVGTTSVPGCGPESSRIDLYALLLGAFGAGDTPPTGSCRASSGVVGLRCFTLSRVCRRENLAKIAAKRFVNYFHDASTDKGNVPIGWAAFRMSISLISR